MSAVTLPWAAWWGKIGMTPPATGAEVSQLWRWFIRRFHFV